MIPRRSLPTNPHIQKLSDFAKAVYHLGCAMEDNDPSVKIHFGKEFVEDWRTLTTHTYHAKVTSNIRTDLIIKALLREKEEQK